MNLYSNHRGHYSNSSVTKIVEKHVFSLFASILLINLFSGPTISVHPYYEITAGTLYSNNHNQLPHGPLQLPIHDQKSRKTSFLTSSLPFTQNAYHGKNKISDHLMTSPTMPSTLMTPHKWPTDHHSHSSMTKNDKKWLMNKFFQHLPLQPPIRHTNACGLSNLIILSLKIVEIVSICY
jgi:hypothetical protein